MRFVTRAVRAILPMLVICLPIGCGNDETAPADGNPPAGKHLWSRRCGDADSQFARAIATDAFGNTIVAGYFYGTVDFGGGALTSASAYDIYLAKLGPSGAHIWSRRFGDGGMHVVQGVATDGEGNVVVAGYFEGTVDFGGGPLTSAGSTDIFVAKFGSDGSHFWSRRFGDADHQAANALALDSSGNVVIAGGIMGTVDFGGGVLTGAGGWDIFVARFGPDGNHFWSTRFGDGNSQYAPTVAVDALHSVFVAGYFAGAVDFGGGPLTSAGSEDIFLAKFASNGNHQWSRRFGDASTAQQAWGLAIDGHGNAIIAGYFTGAVDFGGGALPNAGAQPDVFVAKFGSLGTHLWSKHFGDEYGQSASAVAVDAADNVLVAGGFIATIDFGGATLTSGGAKDVFLAKLGPDGSHLWSKGFGDAGYQDALAVATDASGNACLAGYFEGAVDFGGGALTSAGGEDVFVAAFGQ